jgi:dipeptidyl aminopeptidase/acylaminoacyl peptidase
MPDLVQDYDLSKDRFADWYETMMGNPAANKDLFHERSAINYLDDLKAPMLIFQGANDTNVPKAESQLVYDKLKAMGRTVDMVVYPDEGHGFTKRKNRIDYYQRTVDFFVKQLGKVTP